MLFQLRYLQYCTLIEIKVRSIENVISETQKNVGVNACLALKLEWGCATERAQKLAHSTPTSSDKTWCEVNDPKKMGVEEILNFLEEVGGGISIAEASNAR